MNIIKTARGRTIAALIVAMSLLLPMHAGASVKQRLSGNGSNMSSTEGSASKGFFWSGHFPSSKLNRVYNKANKNFTGAQGHQNKNSNWGSGWRTLSMSLHKGGGHSGFPSSGGGGGGKIPHIKHPLVSELHYDGSTGLTFEGWYKNPNTNSWCDIGNPKVMTTENNSQVPEPMSLLLLALGLCGVVVTRKTHTRTQGPCFSSSTRSNFA